jgi:crotonobetainyl-CoA:carnitine CoA-transferase CaiB-like acyl-CoA transferase
MRIVFSRGRGGGTKTAESHDIDRRTRKGRTTMQPFQGIKVIDMTHVLAGPFCAYQLSVMGADVIKIEQPGEGDMVREAGSIRELNRNGMGINYLTQNSNKRAMTLNLKSAEGREILKRLVAVSDVLIENYRAGAMAALGLGYDDLAKINPRLIYCSMTGFGQKGPKAGHTAYDNVIQALSGMMTTTGYAGNPPVKVGPPVLDYGSGAMAAYAVSCALFQRTRTGKGQHVDVSMLDSALMLMSSSVADYLNSGKAPKLWGNDSDNAGYACYDTKDGMLMIGAWTVRQQVRMWQTLGRPDMAQIANLEEINERHDEQAKVLGDLLKTKTADQWVEIFHKAGLPAERVHTVPEALAHAQLQHRAVIHTHAEVPGVGKDIKVPVAAFTYAHGGPSVRTPPPKHGQHTDDVLGELGFHKEEITAMRSAGVV